MGSRANVPAAGTGTASRERGAVAGARRPPGQPVASRAPEYAVVSDASEADLLPALGARLAAGDQHALEQAYRLLGPSVLAYARRYVGPSEAPDVVQRVFVDVWQSAGRYDPDRSLHAWVFTIAKRRVVDELRRRGSAPAAAHGTVAMVSLGPTARRITINISSLPPAGRGHFYEAWLLQPASGKMLPVGILLTPGSPVSYRLPATLTLGYSYVDISRQANDGDPVHSADSVLRAQLRA